MKIYFILTLLMQAAILLAVFRSKRAIIMTIAEYGDAVGVLGAQLVKALAEIQAEIANIGNVPQPLVDKLTAAQATAQALDDLNPDV